MGYIAFCEDQVIRDMKIRGNNKAFQRKTLKEAYKIIVNECFFYCKNENKGKTVIIMKL